MTGLLAAHDHAQVMFSRRAVFVEQGSTGVTLHVESPTALETFRSDYLIGADGANSLIRKWTGAEFEGFTYPERFLTLSTRYPIERDYDHLALVNYVANGEDWRVLLRVPEFWRILAPCRSEESDADLLSDAKTLEVFSSIVADCARGGDASSHSVPRSPAGRRFISAWACLTRWRRRPFE
ncbi:MAG: FAD-dependent monooxygenase [Alphaproteobacteria bacterium]